MVLSLLVILIPVLLISYLLSRAPDEPQVETVDWKPVAGQAARQAPYEVLAPAELPAGWRATRANWTTEGEALPTGEESVRNQWRLGVLTDDEIYLELVQGDNRPQELIEETTRDAVAAGSTRIDGEPWKRMVTSDDRTRSLVRSTKAVTTVVAGDTGYRQLEQYAASLTPRS